MIIIQASNINVGGGAILLNQLLSSIDKLKIDARVYVDERFKCSVQYTRRIELILVKPKIISRLKVEWLIRGDTYKFKNAMVLFFGNLPPIFKLNCRCFLFFQNVIMLSKYKHFKFSLKTQLKQQIERLWLHHKISNVHTIFVQSESVKGLFLKDFPESKVLVMPFSDLIENKSKLCMQAQYDFIYVASGDPHKNHINLLKAWLLLHEAGILPKLLLVVNRLDTKCAELVKKINTNDNQVDIKYLQTREQISKLYIESKALIYPSLAESFGLPLLEAKFLGLPILASELDYVRDVVEPTETFDPESPVSISRAVQRFLKISQSSKVKMLSTPEF